MNEHGKSLMALAVAYKLTIPIVCHYYAVKIDELIEISKARDEKPLGNKEYLYKIFISYFPLFQKDADLFNKLAVSVNSHLTNSLYEKVMWNRAKNKGITPTIQLNKLLLSIVVDLIPKAVFGKNIIFLLQVSIPEQIKNALIQKDKYEYYSISVASKGEELSGLEKLESNAARISDLDIIISKINITDTLEKLRKKFGVKDWDHEELQFYKKNMKTCVFSELVLQFFAKYFGGYYDLQSIGKKNYIKLVVIFKKVMYNIGFRYIQHIMTGNVSKKIKRRRLSTKQLKKIENDYRFQKVLELYNMSVTDENNPILRNVAMLINTPMTLVDYSMKDRLGEDIQVDIPIVVDEFLRFVEMI
jgi:hypothetical protein